MVLERRFEAAVAAQLAAPGTQAPPPTWRFRLPPPVAATLAAIGDAEGGVPDEVVRYYGEEQPAARVEQLLRGRAPLLWRRLELARLPRLAEGLHGVADVLARHGLALRDLTGVDGAGALIAARDTAAELQAHALFGSGAPILGAGPGDRDRLAAEAARDADATLDLRLSGFLVHEVCHGVAHDGVPPAPWALLEAAALHLGCAARPAHYFPDDEGEALPAVAGFVLIGEAFARHFGAAALYRLSLGASLAGAIGAPAAEALARAGLDDWRRARTAPFVVHALDARTWVDRIAAAAGGGWRDAAPTDADVAMLDLAARAMFHHHRSAPALVAAPSDPPEARLFVDARTATLSALPRPDGCFAEPASWLFPPPLARRLLERGAERVVIEGATRARRADVARALEDLATSDRALPREHVLAF
ncbi:MAG: hypothetical protein KF773_41040 [Deltaproteobacteria bacterium]|nr:hypothetical protein [Deltaproteobacteria bacterium]